MKIRNSTFWVRFISLVLSVCGILAGCVTTPQNAPVTLKTLPPDRCAAPFGKQARETMTSGGPTCVIYFNNSEMKKAERKYSSAVAALSGLKISDGQKKIKSERFLAVWFREAAQAAGRASCPTGMKKAADFPASSVTCTAALEVDRSKP